MADGRRARRRKRGSGDDNSWGRGWGNGSTIYTYAKPRPQNGPCMNMEKRGSLRPTVGHLSVYLVLGGTLVGRQLRTIVQTSARALSRLILVWTTDKTAGVHWLLRSLHEDQWGARGWMEGLEGWRDPCIAAAARLGAERAQPM